MASASTTTIDHDEIRQWAEERKAKPSCVRGTGNKGDIGILRLDFPGYTGEDKLEEISWEEWFGKFEERGLALIHRGDNFNKIINRPAGSSKKASGKKKATAKKSSGAKNSAPKKTSSKKAAPKKTAAKKSASKKSAPKKSTAKKSTAKKSKSR